MAHDLPLITTIAAAFAAAWVLGIITQKLKLSPIVGYLLAGVAIGPTRRASSATRTWRSSSPRVGVILLMFGVGLHFHLKDLLAVRKVALPGAIGQSGFATLLALGSRSPFGWQARSGLVLGMAMSVASTVVLIRVLTDNKVLDTPAGHIAVGWLIVEDVLTVVVLVLIPALGTPAAADSAHHVASRGVFVTLVLALLKLGLLVAILLLGGRRLIPWVMIKVAKLRSRELFTLTVLVMSIAVAAASAYVFGASMALGAFLAGMVVGQSSVSAQAAADILPLRDAFAVLFFASVGMLFDPTFITREPLPADGGAGDRPARQAAGRRRHRRAPRLSGADALTVAIGLAQIGEFSFILSQLGRDLPC
jgi:CPA2 family monovalent cation:H+ antiporter-2